MNEVNFTAEKRGRGDLKYLAYCGLAIDN